MMSEPKENRSKRLHVRFTAREFDKIQNQFARSTDRKLSEYIRKIILNKPVTVRQRNQSLDDAMAELITLRKELNAIGNNFNQTVKRLHTLQELPEIKSWLLLNESGRQILLAKVSEIQSKISQINNQWLQ